MSDVERVAAAMREANEELEVHPADVSETADHARRSLIRRLLIVGALSALGATLLIVGGTAPAITHIRAERSANHDPKNGKGKERGKKKPGKSGKREEKEKEEKEDGPGHPKHHEKLVAAVGPGEPIEVPLPDLVVSHLTKTEVTVANPSSVPAEPFKVSVTLEVKGENPLTVTVSFEEGLEAESEGTETFKLTCESGVISAEVDPTNEIEESSDEDNASTESPPVECEPAEVREEEKTEKGKTKETSGTGSGTAPVDSTTTSPTGGATAP